MKKILLILICLFVSFEVKSQIKDGDIYSCITTNVIGMKGHKVVTFDTFKFNVFVNSERLVLIMGDEEKEFKNKVFFKSNMSHFSRSMGINQIILRSKLDGTKIVDLYETMVGPDGGSIMSGKCVLEE